MVNRVEGLGLPRRRDSGVKACLQACVPGVSGSAEAPRQAAGYVTGSPVRPSGGHALWGEAAVVGGRAEAGEPGCLGFQLTHLFGSWVSPIPPRQLCPGVPRAAVA